MRLALGVKTAFSNHIVGIGKERLNIAALGNMRLIINIGRAGVNFYGIGCHSRGSIHISRQKLKINFDLFSCGAGITFTVGTHNGKGIAILEDFFVTQNRTIPAIPLVVGEGD